MTITPEARELTHKMNAMIDFDKALEAAQLAINAAVSEKDREIERLKVEIHDLTNEYNAIKDGRP